MQGGMSSSAIDSSNVGFRLLKKCGWREGTGLGISEQGRLEPVEAHIKNNKTGLGADKSKNKIKRRPQRSSEDLQSEKDILLQPKKKTKTMSKRLRKMLEEDERMKEREFQQAFFREFWPDNV